MYPISSSKITVYLFLFFLTLQTINAHGEGGSAEIIIDNYFIQLKYSEKPLNTEEPVLFTLSLNNAATGTRVNFNNMQLKISDNEKTLIGTQLSPDFDGRVTFTYRFAYENAFLMKIKFNNGLQTIVETEFILDEFISENKPTSQETKLSRDKNEAVEVLLTDDGFKPKQITISKRTTVTWKNAGNNFHWPASDFHPTHREYPTDERGCLGSNFDACEGLEKNQKYSFTFDKLGSWSVHDHLYPGLTMQIKVIEEVKKKSPSLFPQFMLILDLFNTKKNVENVIEIAPDKFLQLPVPEQRNYLETLSTGDSEAAWEYLKDAFIVNNQVIGNAHELAHIAGNSIYRQHGIKGILLCDPAFGFGCYHGVTEKLLTESGIDNIKEIENQCASLYPSDKGGEAPSCIHGIGHGLLTMNGLNIDKSLNDCDLLLDYNRHYCYDGVFMEHQLSSPAAKIDSENPWEFCTNFDEQYHPSCATYHIVDFLFQFNNNISALADACEASPNPTIYQNCYRSLGLRVSQISQGNPQIIQQLCSAIDNKQGKDTCTIFAAVETIFQEYSGWQQTYRVLCNSLTGNSAQSCLAQTKQTIKSYNRDDSDSYPSQVLIPSTSSSVQSSIIESPEITEIKKLRLFSAGSDIYRKLIVRVGPQQAQEELYRSGLPFSGEAHLLNHASGEYLYENFGAAGLVQCKDYFLSSCYHGFTIDLIADEGLSGVDKVLGECQKKGVATLSQCMHAMGHGFVSWMGYSQLDKAVELCDEVGSQIPNPPLRNCYDGAFMENVWGIHDGVPSPDRWVDDNDPLYPCYDPRIDPKYRSGCLGNSAALMLIAFNENLTKSGELCLSIVDSTERRVCFDGLARHIHPRTFGNIDEVYGLCSNLPENWTNFCVIRIAAAEISIGGRQLPFEICNRIDESYSDTCYRNILNSLNVYAADTSEYYGLCNKVQNPKWQEECFKRASLFK